MGLPRKASAIILGRGISVVAIMKVVCVSDMHESFPEELPDGDLLIDAGDMTHLGTEEALTRYNEWLGRQPHAHKVVIAGNHDFLFETEPDRARDIITNGIYLENNGVEIDGLYLWGSPYTPYYGGWAFNVRRERMHEHWRLIPNDVDILITHGPPYGILDKVRDGKHVGDQALLHHIKRIKPLLHVFGHIHEGHGRTSRAGVEFVNAAIHSDRYQPVNRPTVVELDFAARRRLRARSR